MKGIQLIVGYFLLLGEMAVFAQKPDLHRWEITSGGSALRVTDAAPTGWLLRQQVTYFAHRHLGISLGTGWGKVDNPEPLRRAGDRNEIGKLFYRQYKATELSAVWVPIRGGRHSLRLMAGLAVWRHRSLWVDSVFSVSPRLQQSEIIPGFTDVRRLIPQAGLAYQVKAGPRWLLGIDSRMYRVGARKTAVTLGATATYQFLLNADSLGLSNFKREDFKVGVRLGATHSTGNGKAPSEVYRTRLVGGIWAELPVSLTWLVRGEISYAQRGFRIYEYKRGNMRYLPVLSSQNFLDWTLLFSHEVAYRWRLFVGPQLALFLNGKEQLDGKPVSVRPRNFSGIVVGTTIQLADRIALDGRYQRDLLSFSTNQGGGLHGFQLGLNYVLNY